MTRFPTKGWPSNRRAALYFNNKRRDRFLPPITQGVEWQSGTWYQVSDTVTFSSDIYRCTTTHQASRNPLVDTVHWVEEV